MTAFSKFSDFQSRRGRSCELRHPSRCYGESFLGEEECCSSDEDDPSRLTYSEPGPQIFESRLSTGRNLSRSVNICGFRGMECRGRGTPLPLHRRCRSLPPIRIRHPSSKNMGWCCTANLLTETVQMVADEVFCQLPNNGELQGIPLLRVRLTNMPMFSDRVSISGIRFAPQRMLR